MDLDWGKFLRVVLWVSQKFVSFFSVTLRVSENSLLSPRAYVHCSHLHWIRIKRNFSDLQCNKNTFYSPFFRIDERRREFLTGKTFTYFSSDNFPIFMFSVFVFCTSAVILLFDVTRYVHFARHSRKLGNFLLVSFFPFSVVCSWELLTFLFSFSSRFIAEIGSEGEKLRKNCWTTLKIFFLFSSHNFLVKSKVRIREFSEFKNCSLLNNSEKLNWISNFAFPIFIFMMQNLFFCFDKFSI